jgi:predicted TIM-barrel fold metal-dependent hydrolase
VEELGPPVSTVEVEAGRRRVKPGEPQSADQVLRRAAEQAEQRGFSKLLICDADAHHYETESWAEMAAFIEDPVIKRMALGSAVGKLIRASGMLPTQLNDNDLSGRIPRYGVRVDEKGDGARPRDAVLTRRAMDAMGIDYTILFPSPMLGLGLHPQHEIEVAIARAYARWMTEVICPADPGIKTMLFLPFNSPAQCLRLVQDFGDRPGVVGFLIASVRYRAIHDDDYMPLYAELERRQLPLGIHGSYNYQDRSLELLNRFLSVHALGFPFFTMVHLTNWVINGLPERFPGLKTVWIEGGLAYIPFLMQRLDHEYMMRSSEAPLLRKPPSEYMRELYYTSQPLEVPTHDLGPLKTTFEMIDAERQLLFASDYPHWDFDLPSRVYDLPFLSDQAKRAILGENAMRLFAFDRH